MTAFQWFLIVLMCVICYVKGHNDGFKMAMRWANKALDVTLKKVRKED
jgi:hypothetical protein